jgi:hypothetical protein
MGDVPGVCALPLTRAIVQYRDVHELDHDGGRVEDIGMALVIDGRYAAASEVVDLGSGRRKVLDLSTELVVLDWAYEPTHEHVEELLEQAAASGDDAEIKRYGFQVALRVLERVGFGPLTRPVLLRIGYRDACLDFDLHEGTSVRIVIDSGRVARAHLDYDDCALVFRTALHEADPRFEHALREAFHGARLRRVTPQRREASLEYRVLFELPSSFAEVRGVIAEVRSGLAKLTARFEPARFSVVADLVQTFGARETLSGLHMAASPQEPHSAGETTFVSPTVH